MTAQDLNSCKPIYRLALQPLLVGIHRRLARIRIGIFAHTRSPCLVYWARGPAPSTRRLAVQSRSVLAFES